MSVGRYRTFPFATTFEGRCDADLSNHATKHVWCNPLTIRCLEAAHTLSSKRTKIDHSLASQDGQLNFLQDRRYPDDDEGREAFIKDERRYYKLEDNKKKLISKLFMLMDREVTDKVTSSQGYEEA